MPGLELCRGLLSSRLGTRLGLLSSSGHLSPFGWLLQLLPRVLTLLGLED